MLKSKIPLHFQSFLSLSRAITTICFLPWGYPGAGWYLFVFSHWRVWLGFICLAGCDIAKIPLFACHPSSHLSRSIWCLFFLWFENPLNSSTRCSVWEYCQKQHEESFPRKDTAKGLPWRVRVWGSMRPLGKKRLRNSSKFLFRLPALVY